MEYSELVREIVSRVSAYLEAGGREKQKLIILNHKSEELCREVFRCPKLNAYYELECAMLCGYDCKLEDCAGVLLFDLTNDQLSRITAGICDTPYAAVVEKALLLDKPVFALSEEVELLQYDTGTPYGQMMLEKLRLLEKLGVTIDSYKQLLPIMLEKTGNSGAAEENASAASAIEAAVTSLLVKELTCTKKLITEKDVVSAQREGYGLLRLDKRAIVTDLAKEYAQSCGIKLMKS
jgi:ethanolamine utilization protein